MDITVFPAQPGSYVVIIWPQDDAYVVPIVAWSSQVVAGDRVFLTPLVSDCISADGLGGPELMDAYTNCEWKSFSPGENALHWIALWEGATGRKIKSWDMANWWPSQAPLFATADATLWTDDSIPPS